ncbi:Calx-beta domain-containing protein [Verrucomicrobiota bacterium]
MHDQSVTSIAESPVVIVEASRTLSGPLDITLALSGDAVAGLHYAPLPASVRIASGMNRYLLVVEESTTFTGVRSSATLRVGAAEGTGYGVGTPAYVDLTAPGSVYDLDLPTVMLTAESLVLGENGGSVDLVLTRNVSTNWELRVSITPSGSEAVRDEDFSYPDSTNTWVIPAGTNRLVVTLTGLDDELLEGDESILLTAIPHVGGGWASNEAYNVAEPGYVQLTMTDDERVLPTVSLAASASVIDEPGGSANLVLSRSRDFDRDLQVSMTFAGTGEEDVDATYAHSGHTWTIPAGESQLLVPVTGLDDDLIEPDETLHFTLIPQTGPQWTEEHAYDVGTGVYELTLLDDEAAQFEIRSLVISGSVAVVEWYAPYSSSTANTFTIEAATNLLFGGWDALTNGVPGNPSGWHTNAFPVASPGEPAYYRVRLE